MILAVRILTSLTGTADISVSQLVRVTFGNHDRKASTRVLVLGAYGFFGSRICTALARNPRVQLVLVGRDLHKATALAYQLGLTANHARRADATDPRLGRWLRKLGVDVLIHTAGPFQEQDYSVARAAIEAGCHYLDLADGRAFVTGITRLDAAARAANIAVLSGVSSLPALSSAVVDRYLPQFSRLDAIRMGITFGRGGSRHRHGARRARLLRQADPRVGGWRLEGGARLARHPGPRVSQVRSARAGWAAATCPTWICCHCVIPV